MPSERKVLEDILGQLAPIGADILSRPMMGEYLLYYCGRLFGGIYDNRLLVKPIAAAKEFVGECRMEHPYPGAKEMLLIQKTDDSTFLCGLVQAMYDGLPKPKQK